MTEETETKKTFRKKIEVFHDKYYKLLLIIPLVILAFSFIYMVIFYINTGDFVHKDFSLTGGTSITLIGKVNGDNLETILLDELDEINTREIYDLRTGEQTALIVQTKTDSEEAKEILEDYLEYELDDSNSSFEFIGSDLSGNFYKELLMAIFIAFVFMALVVFFIFRSFVPSLAVVISAFADIFMTLTLINILGIEMSSAGLVAFLMLIGYSVDTDILLTNRILKRYGDLNEKFYKAFKTGITMTLTSLIALAFALFISTSFSLVLTQIFTVLVIGLAFDIFNTWITNASILKWYVKKNEN